MIENLTVVLDIVCHATGQPTEEENLECSRTRGEAVASYLASLGIEKTRMVVTAHGCVQRRRQAQGTPLE